MRHKPSFAQLAREYASPACLLHEFESEVHPMKARDVQVKRVYDDPKPADGWRVLVDRLWPRGLRRDEAALDEWLRDVAPSPALRKWFGHDPQRWTEFRRRYRSELEAHDAEVEMLRERSRSTRVTLLYAARDSRVNHAVVLQEVVLGKGAPRASARAGRATKARAKRTRAKKTLAKRAPAARSARGRAGS